MYKSHFFAVSTLILALASPSSYAIDFSFTGLFSADTDVQLINFSLLADSSNVIIETLSLNGGGNAAGDSIAAGGFDPYLALFNQADGSWIFDTLGKNSGDEAEIAGFGNLPAGDYILALTEYDNVAAGLNIADGFAAALGLASFGGTPFTFNGGGGSGHWAVDIYNIDTAALASQLPLPGTVILILSGLLSLLTSKSLSTPKRSC